MPGFTESNITVNFPDANFFRFCNCPGYTYLSGNHFKEMDACWIDNANDIIWLIELKDFTLAAIDTPETVEARTWDLVKKSVDSLSMLLCTIHNYPYAVDLTPCFPTAPTPNTGLKLMTIIHCDHAQIADVQHIHNAFRNKFKPYADLFGIAYYGVIEHNQAIALIPNNMIQ